MNPDFNSNVYINIFGPDGARVLNVGLKIKLRGYYPHNGSNMCAKFK